MPNTSPNNLLDYLFIEVKTTKRYPSIDDLDSKRREYIEFYAQQENMNPEEFYNERGAVRELTADICAVAIGSLRTEQKEGDPEFDGATKNRIYYFDTVTLMGDELPILNAVSKALMNSKRANKWLAGYGLKTFDSKYLVHKMWKHEVSVPPPLDTKFKKPWEVQMVDMMDMWRAADPSGRIATKAAVLLETFNIATPTNMERQKEVTEALGREDWQEIDNLCLEDLKYSLYLLQRMVEDKSHVLVRQNPYKLLQNES